MWFLLLASGHDDAVDTDRECRSVIDYLAAPVQCAGSMVHGGPLGWGDSRPPPGRRASHRAGRQSANVICVGIICD